MAVPRVRVGAAGHRSRPELSEGLRERPLNYRTDGPIRHCGDVPA
jgi:hypothetical protein